jgi:Phosphotransferase enzyme family
MAELAEWVRAHVGESLALELVHERPWSRVYRVPRPGGDLWLKACAPVQAFEPHLTDALSARWPGLLPEVVAHDEPRSLLLLGDAGTPVRAVGNPPELWFRVLPRYAELQVGEAEHIAEHLAHHVPDLRLAALPARYEQLVARELPLRREEMDRLRSFQARFGELCRDLAGRGIPETIQHDDLHMGNLFVEADRLRVLDWGDASVGHPFASLVVTFRFLEETNRLPSSDPWFARLRDAYLEPWGSDLVDTFDLAVRVGSFAHCCAWLRQRDALPEAARPSFDTGFAVVLRRALARTVH